jgi:hypothetical protein
MIGQLLSFLLGALLASSWWSLTVMPRTPDGWEWCIPISVTIIFTFIFLFWCLVHLES